VAADRTGDADDTEPVPRPRRSRRDPPERREPAQRRAPTRRREPTERTEPTERAERSAGRNGQVRSAAAAAKIAIREIAGLTGRTPDNIVSIQRREDGWCVAVELVETHRIPDTADILAIYEAELDEHGELVSYRRTRRYLRGRVQEN
jgi:Gas vesicle synthesis protein GvpO